MKKFLWTAFAASAFVATPVLACDAARAQAMEEARSAAFAEADSNGDGALSADEFPAFEDAMQRQRAAAHFAFVDADGDGKVTAQELEDAKPPHPPRF